MNIPELLAPVGSREALAAAVQNGADAVYLGGKVFSARQYANNFDREELREAVDYAHVRGVKVYITVNTLVSDTELPEAAGYVRYLYEIGVDAVIVQDLGVASLIQELLPSLPMHGSTQMTIHSSSGVEMLSALGFKRIVLARELSLAEISGIKKKTGMETEVFVHGALCISYSGQCLMSSMIGGRSGNRGRCAQPCRMEYSLVDAQGAVLAEPEETGRHLLSPRDLNMVRHIPELAEAGVSSLKIEGRMKRPEYVAIVTRIYREALNRYSRSPADYTVSEQEIKDLAQIFNRGFSTGYFFGNPGKELMSYKRPNNRGLRLGRVTAFDRNRGMVEVQLEDILRRGDGIEFWVTEGGRRGMVVNRILAGERQIEEAGAGQKVWLDAEGRIRPGDRVFKTHDMELISRAEQSYKSSKELKKIPLKFTVRAEPGRPLVITAADDRGDSFTACGDIPGQEALNKPLTKDYLQKQLDRLGNTPFELAGLEAEIAGRVMYPVSEINEVRRQAVEGLAAARAACYGNRSPVEPEFDIRVRQVFRKPEPGPKEVSDIILAVRVHGLAALKAALNGGADLIYFGGSGMTGGSAVGRDAADRGINEKGSAGEMEEALSLCSTFGAELVISTPRITREKDMNSVRPVLEFAADHILPVLAGNAGILKEAGDCQVPELYADFSFNIYNSMTLRWLENKADIVQAALSPELTMEQVAFLAGQARVRVEALVEGHLPLMVTEYCPPGSLLGGRTSGSACQRPCQRLDRGAGLRDRMGLVFPVAHDRFCRTHIYNAKELSMIEDIKPLFKAGVSVFRLETSIEDLLRTEAVVRLWRGELNRFTADPDGYQPGQGVKDKIAAMSPAGLTKGHFYRGVE